MPIERVEEILTIKDVIFSSKKAHRLWLDQQSKRRRTATSNSSLLWSALPRVA